MAVSFDKGHQHARADTSLHKLSSHQKHIPRSTCKMGRDQVLLTGAGAVIVKSTLSRQACPTGSRSARAGADSAASSSPGRGSRREEVRAGPLVCVAT